MDRHKKLAMILCSIGLMFLITGITYAYFNYTKTGEENTLVTGDIYMHLNEGQDQITLTNIFPETAEEARARNDNEITFTIDGLNTSNKIVYYEIDLVHGDDLSGYTRFNDGDLKFDLIEVGSNNEETYLVNAGSYADLTNKKVWVDTVDPNTTTEIERTYKLRMWLSEDVIISDSDPNRSYYATGENAFKNHFASIRVKVIGDFQEKDLPGAYYQLAKDVDTTKVINFANASSSSNGQGLYILPGTTTDAFPIYYYRGAVDNNNVIFGGFCWQMVRTTDTGGIKMIYNGVATANGTTCTNTTHADRILTNTSAFNTNNQSMADIGYMNNTRFTYAIGAGASGSIYGKDIEWDGINYLVIENTTNTASTNTTKDDDHHYSCGTSGTTSCNSVRYYYYNNYYITLSSGDLLEDAIYKMTGNGSQATKEKNAGYNLNANDSTIKGVIDAWFRTNLTNEVNSSNLDYSAYIEDTVYCNDRSFKTIGNSNTYSTSGWNSNGGNITTDLYFGTNNRYNNSNWYSTTNVPTIKNSGEISNVACPNESDRFTVSSSIGNGALTYPVGLLTVDEIIMAGASGNSSSTNNTYYLYTGGNYWSLSPNYFTSSSAVEFRINDGGSLNYNFVYSTYGVRPVVSLKLGVEFESNGDGTPTNPYVVKYN